MIEKQSMTNDHEESFLPDVLGAVELIVSQGLFGLRSELSSNGPTSIIDIGRVESRSS